MLEYRCGACLVWGKLINQVINPQGAQGLSYSGLLLRGPNFCETAEIALSINFYGCKMCAIFLHISLDTIKNTVRFSALENIRNVVCQQKILQAKPQFANFAKFGPCTNNPLYGSQLMKLKIFIAHNYTQLTGYTPQISADWPSAILLVKQYIGPVCLKV